MHRNAFHREARKPGGLAEQRGRFGPVHAELVRLAAGADLVESAGIDIGIDPHGDGCGPAETGGDAREAPDLGCALDIDLEYAGRERGLHLRIGLADAGEHDPLRRDASGERAPQLPFRHDIGARAQARQQAQHRQVAVRLHRIADARRRQHSLELAVGGFDGVGGIDIDGRADLGRDVRQPDRSRRQAAVDVVERSHLAG